MSTWRERREHTSPLALWEVLAEEFEQDHRRLPASFDRFAEAALSAPSEHAAAARQDAEQKLFELLRAQGRTALCFSGGGVRSATFGLGVLEGLATSSFGARRVPALSQFDYLSTVSGGGYVGAWYSSWATRLEKKHGIDGPREVERRLQQPGPSLDPDPGPLHYIRRYCAFLTPKLGLLSADAWTLAATVLRNMVLNWLILVPLLMCALLIPAAYESLLVVEFDQSAVRWLLYAGFAAAFIGISYMSSRLPTFSMGDRSGESSFLLGALVPLTVGAACLSLHWYWRLAFGEGNYTLTQYLLFGANLHVVGWVGGIVWLRFRRHPPTGGIRPVSRLGGAVAALVSGLVAGWLGYVFSRIFASAIHRSDYLGWYATLGVPAVLTCCVAAAILTVGFASRITGDEDREWWARAGGWIMIVIFGWLACAMTVLLGPQWLRSAWSRGVAAAGSLGLGGIISSLGFSGSTGAGRRGDKEAQTKRCSPAKELAASLAGPAFLWALLVLLSVVNQLLISRAPFQLDLTAQAVLFLIFGAVALVSAAFINVNRFSLHAMYRNRLIRTYLGASHVERDRTVNRFTDFDEADNLDMCRLTAHGPLHVVNMALNLVGGDNLAWQQRKAESFTATRLRSGSLRVGYQRTGTYGGKNGLSLGSAIAISGAAASPNMGYHSSPLITFIMTLFNARLGWWLANPGLPGKRWWHKDGPALAFVPILNEALGRTNDTSNWVYLSDGGHFENLGLYEMVLRRCGTIVVVDGSQDSEYNFEDLGNAIRKIRVDLGISVEFPDGLPIYAPTDLRNRYCAIGDIHYEPKGSGAQPGRLLYIKACLNGGEPQDVLHYAALNSDFPQQSTAELWFDESQFESYRRLGLHIAQELASNAPAAGSPVESLVDGAASYIHTQPVHQHSRWPKPPSFAASITGTLTGAAVALQAELRGD